MRNPIERLWRACPAPAALVRGVRGTACAAALAAAAPAAAGAPEYTKLNLHVGQALEISGARNGAGLFVASDVEVLKEPRRPQLRGGIDAIDTEKRVLTVLGLAIHVPEDAVSEDPDSLRVPFQKLKPGMRLEISCSVKENGAWQAKRIRAHGVKASDKIKGTLTRVQVDNAPPDTVEVSGFKILFDDKTDVNVRLGARGTVRDVLFRDLQVASAYEAERGRAHAGGHLLVRVLTRSQLAVRHELDLAPGLGSNLEEVSPELRVAATGYFGPHLRTRFHGRAKGLLYVQSTVGALNSTAVEVLEANALWQDLGIKGLTLQVGRQDLDEPREWIFDEYQDAARLYGYTERGYSGEVAVLHGIHPLKATYDGWTDFYATARWHPNPKSSLAIWTLNRHDTSLRAREPVWAGVHYIGRFGAKWRPWADLAFMRGSDKGRALSASALDVGGTVTWTQSRWTPAVTAGYATGSGDASLADGVDGNFRQTGYQDNYARLGGVNQVKYYGVLLDPELSNLQVTTLAAAMRPVPDSSVEVLWHRYQQREALATVRSQNLLDPPARPNGFFTDLGWELDAVLSSPLIGKSTRLIWATGFFHPGEAFSPRLGEAFLHTLQISAEF